MLTLEKQIFHNKIQIPVTIYTCFQDEYLTGWTERFFVKWIILYNLIIYLAR